MELDFAVLADGVTQRPDGKLDIFGAGFDHIFASAVGCDVAPSGWYGHATLRLPGSFSDQDWENLVAEFDEPQENPVGRRSHG